MPEIWDKKHKTNKRVIHIEPVTRLEGHAKIDIFLDKDVTLVGENKINTIIDGQNHGSVITIDAEFFAGSIEGFTIQNSGTAIDDAGLKINGETFIVMIFMDNIVQDNNYGIKISPDGPNFLLIQILSNKISNNMYGFYSDANNLFIVSLCIIEQNTMDNNTCGIYLKGTRKNFVAYNKIIDNYYGVYLKKSKRNFFFFNDFLENTIHATFVKSRKNIWLANYWDNWIGLKLGIFRLFPKKIIGRNGLIFGLIPSIDRDIFAMYERYTD